MIGLIRSSFKIALDSLWVSKIRSLLTILGIVIGVFAVIILVSMGNGLRSMINQQFMNLGANLIMVLPGKIDLKSGNFQQFAAMANSKLTVGDAQAIRAVPNVAEAVPFSAGYLPVSNLGQSVVVEVLGSDENYVRVLSWSLEYGRNFTAAEVNAGKKVAVLGSETAKDLFNGDPTGRTVVIGSERYKVVGELAPKGGGGQLNLDKRVFIPISAAKVLFGSLNVQVIYFQVADRSILPTTIAEVKNVLLRRHKEDEFSVLQSGDLLKSVDAILGAVTLALAGIAAISLMVGGIGIMNIMLVSVSERTREIGLRKAVGASFNDILWQFLIEAVVVSSAGGLLGVLLGFLGAFILGKFIATEVTLWSVFLAFSFSALTGIVFGILPALKAARLDPIEALRYE
ncbi:MAG: ABC transporter permease [Patescibacteria group bacterium]|nr:ABC transporter permease [Patescibacteria group bacterium]